METSFSTLCTEHFMEFLILEQEKVKSEAFWVIKKFCINFVFLFFLEVYVSFLGNTKLFTLYVILKLCDKMFGLLCCLDCPWPVLGIQCCRTHYCAGVFAVGTSHSSHATCLAHQHDALLHRAISATTQMKDSPPWRHVLLTSGIGTRRTVSSKSGQDRGIYCRCRTSNQL